MTPLSFIRRFRARRRLKQAQVKYQTVLSQIHENKRKHRAWRPLMGILAEVRTEMLRAEIALGGR